MSFDDLAIDVIGLGKAYRVFPTPPDRLKQLLWRGKRQFFSEFWALHPVSFQVKRGECVGFLGKNGSGKSTLLQMIAGTLDPSHGSFQVAGRLSALLELGAGFNPEFTGRENVILSGALLGIGAQEMQERLPAILEFSELGHFIDKPVKTYSSGMYVRLAFSAAIHVEPDVLLVDEALSVGDAAFQYKCLQRIETLRSRGMSILFVTHDTAAVRKICNRAGWLDSGRLVDLGNATHVADDYDSFMRERAMVVDDKRPASSEVAPQVQGDIRIVAGDEKPAIAARIKAVKLLDENGSEIVTVLHGGMLRVSIEYEVLVETAGLVIGAAIFRNDELYVSGLNTGLDGFVVPINPGSYVATLDLPNIQLLGAEYYFKVGVFDQSGMVRWDFLENAKRFKVSGGYVAEGVMVPEHNWSVSVSKEEAEDLYNPLVKRNYAL